MARKKRKKPTRQKRPAFHAKFSAGTQVQVKAGVKDPDYPDIPLGGWSGIIEKVDRNSRPIRYLIEWDEHTLANMHPVYRNRCERDGLDEETIWLGEEDITSAADKPVPMEQPKNLITRTLRKNDQDDRVRAVFGLTSDDPLPDGNEATLSQYHYYLRRHLSFPFKAKFSVEIGPFEEKEYTFEVVDLLDPEDCDLDDGLCCEAVREDETLDLPLGGIEVTTNVHNRQMIEDYSYWFWNWRGEDSIISHSKTAILLSDERPFTRTMMVRITILCGVIGAIYGLALGTFVGAIEEARIGAGIGAFLLGLIGFVTFSKEDSAFATIDDGRTSLFLSGLFGALLAALTGTLLGAILVALVVAYKGVIIASLIGAIIGYLLAKVRQQVRWIILGVLIGACVGPFVQVFIDRFDLALQGALYGIVIGCVSGMVFYWGLVAITYLVVQVTR